MARSSRKKNRGQKQDLPPPQASLAHQALELTAASAAAHMLSAGSAREAAREAARKAELSRSRDLKTFWLRVRYLIMARSRSKRNGFRFRPPAPKPPTPRLPPPHSRPSAHTRVLDNPRGGEQTISKFRRTFRALPEAPTTKLDPVYRGVYDPRFEASRAVARGTSSFGLATAGPVDAWDDPTYLQRSWERYQNPDHLIRARQKYELQLSKGSRGARAPFRVLAEPTRSGWKYFVWPLHGRQRTPKGFKSLGPARRYVEGLLSRGVRPSEGLSSRHYTQAELSEWLPSDVIFSGRSGIPTAASRRKRRETLPGEEPVAPPRKARKKTARTPTKKAPVAAATGSTPQQFRDLMAAYAAYDPDWKSKPHLVDRWVRDLPPPSR